MAANVKKVQPMNVVPEGAVLLGEGALSWERYERVGDRYGTVTLWAPGDKEKVRLATEKMPGAYGFLCVKVVKAQQSEHIGDLFHGFYPGGAVEGEVFALGDAGKFYVPDGSDTTAGGIGAVGVQPMDERATFWLNPLALYRAHEQVVRLWAVPGGGD